MSKLEQAKKWFSEVTEADPELIGFMGITSSRLVEMYEWEVKEKGKGLVPVATLPEIASDLLSTTEMLRAEIRKNRPDAVLVDQLACRAVTAAVAVSGLAARQYEIMKERGL